MTEPLRCLIVDDETAAHYVLENYIGRVDRLVLAGKCYNAVDALNFLHRERVDLLFLDINMPELSGLELLGSLTHSPRTILTTAYAEFALKSYDFGVVDYLLKPIPFPRFLKAIDKVLALATPAPAAAPLPVVSSPEEIPAALSDSIMIKVDTDWVRVRFDEILYAQSWGNYVKLYLPGRMLLTTTTTSELEKRLPPDQFLRIHKSYIVSLSKVERMSSNMVLVDGAKLPVGITFRRELVDRLR